MLKKYNYTNIPLEVCMKHECEKIQVHFKWTENLNLIFVRMNFAPPKKI